MISNKNKRKKIPKRKSEDYFSYVKFLCISFCYLKKSFLNTSKHKNKNIYFLKNNLY